MTEVKIKPENVLKAYKNADQNVKQAIKDLVGDQVNFNRTFMDLETFDDCCNAIGESMDRDVKSLLEYEGKNEIMLSSMRYAQAIIICEAFNDGEKMDATNKDQIRHWHWYEWKPGFGLSLSHVYDSRTASYCGSRLCFKDEARARRAFEKFPTYFQDYIIK